MAWNSKAKQIKINFRSNKKLKRFSKNKILPIKASE